MEEKQKNEEKQKMQFGKFNFFSAWVYQRLRGLVRMILDLREACLLRSWERFDL